VNPSFIRQRFDQRAARYDNPLTAWIGEQELRQIRPLIPPDATVLDYGCGATPSRLFPCWDTPSSWRCTNPQRLRRRRNDESSFAPFHAG
jgi:hypothetical protein